jgi:L-ribulokinase
MGKRYLIGLDFGTESVRGVLVDVGTAAVAASQVAPYRHGVMTTHLSAGQPLPVSWALQDALDFVEAAETILTTLGAGRHVLGIGIDCTASTPLPTRADGTPLSALYPAEPHAYAKLWKHRAAYPWAERINATSGQVLERDGGKTFGEWMPAKAAQLADEAPHLWRAADRFIEAGDWIVWQLTGYETRSLGFAGYKCHFNQDDGYPPALVPGLDAKIATPVAIGCSAGPLSAAWRERTGIEGEAVVSVAVIDAHAVLPAAGITRAGTIVGSLGTSGCYMALGENDLRLDPAFRGVKGGALPGVWCHEASQAACGDVLGWFVRSFPHRHDPAGSFAYYDDACSRLAADESRPLALDWWNGSRVSLGNASGGGMMLGLGLQTAPADMYWALLESLCFGARHILETFASAHVETDRLVLASGLAERAPVLMQMMADVLERDVQVPALCKATAVGAAIHAAVASGTVPNFDAGADRFGAKEWTTFHPRAEASQVHNRRYTHYLQLSGDATIVAALRALYAQGDGIDQSRIAVDAGAFLRTL